jgi:hypothetical protein
MSQPLTVVHRSGQLAYPKLAFPKLASLKKVRGGGRKKEQARDSSNAMGALR